MTQRIANAVLEVVCAKIATGVAPVGPPWLGPLHDAALDLRDLRAALADDELAAQVFQQCEDRDLAIEDYRRAIRERIEKECK